LGGPAFSQSKPDLDKVIRDESHCLPPSTCAETKTGPISCFCRDSIVEARYDYFEYLNPLKDLNLGFIFWKLLEELDKECGIGIGTSDEAYKKTIDKNWTWLPVLCFFFLAKKSFSHC